MLGIGLAAVSAQRASQNTNQIPVIVTLPDTTNDEINRRSDKAQLNRVPRMSRSGFIHTFQSASTTSLESPYTSIHHPNNLSDHRTSAHSAKQLQTDCLIKHINADINEPRLAMPARNIAWEKQQLILQQDPENVMARVALQSMLSSYIQLAKSAGIEEDERAQRYYLDQIHLVLYGCANTGRHISQDISSHDIVIN